MRTHFCGLLTLVASVTSAQVQVQPPDQTKPIFLTVDGFRPNFGRHSLQFADLDADGYLDVVGPAGDGVYMRRGLGRGDFATIVAFPAPPPIAYPTDVAVGDIDRDGDLDLLLVRLDPGTSHLFLNDGQGVFVDASQTAFGTAGVLGRFLSAEFADIDNDDDLDIVFGCDGPMRVFVNDGRGHFVEDSSRMPGLVQVTDDFVVADMNGDGFLDLVTGNGGEVRYDVNYVLYNDGTGRFFNYVLLPGGLGATMAVATGDIDGDGDLDVLFARVLGSNVLLRNDGIGAFTDISARLVPNSPQGRTEACLIADVDADGDQDLVIGTATDLQIQLSDGRGQFRRMARDGFWGVGTTGVFGIIWSLHYRDLDNDGDGDLYVCQSGFVGVTPIVTEIYFGARTHMWSPGFAAVGGTVTVRVFGFEGVAFLAFAGSRPNAHFPTPFGQLWLDPASMVIDPTPIAVSRAGLGDRVLQIPNSPSLRNRALHMQALHLASTPPWSRLTNWHKITIL